MRVGDLWGSDTGRRFASEAQRERLDEGVPIMDLKEQGCDGKASLCRLSKVALRILVTASAKPRQQIVTLKHRTTVPLSST